MKTVEPAISHKAEDYLEAIYRLEKKKGSAKTMELARKLKVVSGSVTNTVESLERRGLIIHKPYKGVNLTDRGRKIASNVLRKHRLAERLLADYLHMKWSEVHSEACKLEHALSPKIINHLEKALGFPKKCPHGNPIPALNGQLFEEETKPLTDLNSGEDGIIVKIIDENPSVLKVLDSLGLTPRSFVKVERKGSITDHLNILVNGKSLILEQKFAIHIHVKSVKKIGEE
jgi:DtxR family Mn-dependent transcriptional regulator